MECEPAPFLGKRKEIGDQEEAIGGQSKKATLEEKGKGQVCQICSSKTHMCRCCPWNVLIPHEIAIPEVASANWMVVCKSCGIERKPSDENKACSECGSFRRQVEEKICITCRKRGHLDIDDKDCKYYGVSEENDPFRLMAERLFKNLVPIDDDLE